MQLYNPNDLNDPNNPFGKSYRPKYVMEFHVKQGSKPPIPRDQLLGYPECAVNIALKQPYPATIGIISSTLTVNFTGRVKSTMPVFRKKFEADKQKIQDRLLVEAYNWLASFKFLPNINLNDWAKSSATVTSPSTGAYPSTITVVSQDVVSGVVTAGSSSITVGIDQIRVRLSFSLRLR